MSALSRLDLRGQLVQLDSIILAGVSSEFPRPLTDAEHVAVNSYLVLSHAVIEEFIEDVFIQYFKRLLLWLKSDQIPLELGRLLFAARDKMINEKELPYPKRDITQIAPLVVAKFEVQVRQNHGVKEENVKRMASLVGVDWKCFERELAGDLVDLNTLGSKRGPAGHLSPYSNKLQLVSEQVYPDDLRAWVRPASEAAIHIRDYLCSLISGQEPLSLIIDWDGN